jgi:hypothetical protein
LLLQQGEGVAGAAAGIEDVEGLKPGRQRPANCWQMRRWTLAALS